MAPGHKKVVVRRFSSGLLWGYLPANGIVQSGTPPSLHLLDLGGRVTPALLTDVKYVSYVRDFNTSDAHNPERLPRKFFLARPRGEGLWLRLGFRDGDKLEGLGSIDIALAEDFTSDLGLYILPPDARGNTQRIYIPRSAIETMQVLAVVTSPSQKKKPEPRQPHDTQRDLFTLELPPGTRPQ